MRQARVADEEEVRDLLATMEAALRTTTGVAEPPELQLQAVSAQAGAELVPRLMEAIDRASGWVLQRYMTSASTLHVCVEAQGRSLLDVYACFLEQGLDLNRSSHQLLTEQCSLVHLHTGARSSIFTLHMQVALPSEEDRSEVSQWTTAGAA